MKIELLKASNIKKHVNNLGLRLSKDALEHLDRKVLLAVTSAVKAAKDNDRTTVRAEDLF